MLDEFTRRVVGKCAADLYDAGNRRESLDLLRQLADASEGRGGELLDLDWRSAVRAGAKRSRCPVPQPIRSLEFYRGRS